MMIRPTEQCDPASLRQLLEKSLSPVHEDAVIEHLSDCTYCQQQLEIAAGDERWWSELPAFLSDAPAEPPVIDESTIDSPTGVGDRAEVDVQRWLAPSDDPRMLGRVGSYEIAGVIGRGSTGIVLKAFEPALHRYVAIKWLAPELAHASVARKRFAREARAAAAVTHEHIVPIHAVSEFQNVPYMVMQYVPGHSLQQRIDQEGPLGLLATVRIALQTARALAAAHQQGLVHRDIKPANILLNVGVEHALVTDFGLARVADDASLTHSGSIAGTPQYMSPEQARGETTGPASDLFSLGSLIYAMCSGHSPFRAETMVGVIHRVCEAEPRPLRELNADVPRWLEAFVAKLLAKRPEDRFADATEVADLLEKELAHLQHPTAIAEPERDWLDSPTSRPRLTTKLAMGIAAVALLAAALSALAPVTEPGGELTDRQVAEGAANVGSEESTNWQGVKIRWNLEEADKRRSTVSMLQADEQRFVLNVTSSDGRQRALVLESTGKGRSSLRFGQGPRQKKGNRSRELIDDIYLTDVAVTTRHGGLCFHARGSKKWSNSSTNSSSSESATSQDGRSSSKTTRNRTSNFSSGTTTYSIAFAAPPWKTKEGPAAEIACLATEGVDAVMHVDREGDRCILEIRDQDDNERGLLYFHSDGSIKAMGKDIQTRGSRVTVKVNGDATTIQFDGKQSIAL